MVETMIQVRELRVRALEEHAKGDYNLHWDFENRANKMELRILKRDIIFLTSQYVEALESGNKSQVIYLGRTLRKKQTRLESFNSWEEIK